MDEDNASMQESSLSSKGLGAGEDKHDEEEVNDDEQSPRSMQAEEEEIDSEENPFQIPPLINQPINKETLHDSNHPYIFWASLKLPIPKDLVNPMAMVYDVLEEFVMTLAEEDPHFVVFPHNLSEFELVEDWLCQGKYNL